jgi:hypothetical protein
MKLKAMGLAAVALIAALAISGVPFAGAEEEAAPEYQSENNPATVDIFSSAGIHEQYIRVTNEKGENLDVKCGIRSANLVTSTTFPTTSIQTRVAFGECTVDGEKAAGVANECEYLFNLVAGSNPATATLKIICPGTKEIEFESAKCRVFIPPQENLKHVVYSNNEAAKPPEAVETFSITGLKYWIYSGCRGESKTESKTNGIYTDGLKMQATSGGLQVGFWVK